MVVKLDGRYQVTKEEYPFPYIWIGLDDRLATAIARFQFNWLSKLKKSVLPCFLLETAATTTKLGERRRSVFVHVHMCISLFHMPNANPIHGRMVHYQMKRLFIITMLHPHILLHLHSVFICKFNESKQESI